MMIDKRLLLALCPLALLAACNDEAGDDSRAATGEVLEGTVSDAMLPVDRVRSEPPLEDPEAFEAAQEEASEAATGHAGGQAEGQDSEGEPAAETPEAPAAGPAPEAE
jgi:hypothetical protein